MNEMGLYLHIPFCMRKCAYCDFLSGAYDEKTQEIYTNSLCNEIAFMGKQLQEAGAPLVTSIFIGGGTPSWLDAEYMQKIMEAVYASFSVSDMAEISMECNPGTVSKEKFDVYRRLGINRISIGLQSANDDELKLLGRVHNYDRFLHTFDYARKSGFYNINVDIMTGLPGQDFTKLSHTLEKVIQLRPEHISAYSLIIEEGTPFYEQYKFDVVKQHAGQETEFLPSEELEYQLYKMTQQTLEAHGYHQYEISNYAREDYECSHNKIYWQRKPYLGLGIGAASLYKETIQTPSGTVTRESRTSNIRDIYKYMEICNDLPGHLMQLKQQQETDSNGSLLSPLWESNIPLSRKDAMEEFMFLGLRMNEGVTREGFEQAFGCNIDGIYANVLRKLKEEELLVTEGGRIYLTDKGMDLSNYALANFLLDN